MSTVLNTTVNGTPPTNCSIPDNPSAERIWKTVAYCLFFVVSMAGNCFIGAIVYKKETMRKPINFLIVNMAVSDFLFPIFVFPPILVKLYVDSWLVSGFLGQALCKVVSLLQFISASVSIQSLVLIAVDRFGAVLFPLRSPLISPKLCPFFILATWMLAIAIYSPMLVNFKLVQHPDKLDCGLFFKETFSKNYFLTLSVLFFYIPFGLIIVLYSIMFLKLKSKKIPGEQSFNIEEQRAKRQRNVLKMVIAIVFGFALCWLPLNSFLILVFLGVRFSCEALRYGFISRLMAYANCAINPCICFIFSGNYRQGLKSLLMENV